MPSPPWGLRGLLHKEIFLSLWRFEEAPRVAPMACGHDDPTTINIFLVPYSSYSYSIIYLKYRISFCGPLFLLLGDLEAKGFFGVQDRTQLRSPGGSAI